MSNSTQRSIIYRCLQYCGLLDWKPDEYGAVPKGMGDNDSAKFLWEEPVGESPDQACDKCRHDQHEVELGQMHEAIDQRGGDKSQIWTPSLGETVLYESSPEDLFCRSDDQKHKEGEYPRVLAFFHSIDKINLWSCEVEHQ